MVFAMALHQLALYPVLANERLPGTSEFSCKDYRSLGEILGHSRQPMHRSVEIPTPTPTVIVLVHAVLVAKDAESGEHRSVESSIRDGSWNGRSAPPVKSKVSI